jgi:hypothetical protein
MEMSTTARDTGRLLAQKGGMAGKLIFCTAQKSDFYDM